MKTVPSPEALRLVESIWCRLHWEPYCEEPFAVIDDKEKVALEIDALLAAERTRSRELYNTLYTARSQIKEARVSMEVVLEQNPDLAPDTVALIKENIRRINMIARDTAYYLNKHQIVVSKP